MKISTIRWIAFLTILGLLGVLAIQAYWVSRAIKVQSAAFDRAATEALASASERLELEEDKQVVVSKRIQEELFIDTLFLRKQAVNVPKKQFLWKSGDTLAQAIVLDSADQYRITYQIDSATAIVKGKSTTSLLSKKRAPASHTERLILRKADSLQIDLETTLEAISARKERIDSLIGEMIVSIAFQPLSWEERLSEGKLHSTLSEEIDFKGLPEDFQYAVYSPTDSLHPVMHSDKFDSLKAGYYQIPLYKNDLIRGAATLKLFFPSKKIFVLEKIWLLIAVSMLFSTILILSAAAAIITLFRQKKLHQIRADLISNVSHEFRTPLASIGLAANALENKKVEASPDLQSYYISLIKKENLRMQGKVDQLIQTALAEHAQLKMQMQALPIPPLVSEAIDAMAMQIEARKGSVELALQGEPLLAMVSKEHLSTALLNILDNAIKYCKAAPQIRIRIWQENARIAISITDNGPGMDRHTLRQVFERFFRASQGNIHNVKGFGLGLSYVKAVMNAMEGSIEVISEEGKGSTFTLFVKQAQTLEQ